MRLRSCLWILIGLAACDSPVEPSRLVPGLNIDVRGPLTDTVVSPPTLVRVTLIDGARTRLAAATVQISAIGSNSVWVGADTSWSTRPPTTTDANGRLEFWLRRTGIADTAWVRVVATTGATTWRDSVQVITTAGRPAHVLMPVDTAMYSGNTMQWRGTVTDQYGNRRTEVPTYQPGTAGITMTGSVISANDRPSRQLVIASVGAFRDSALLSIVPRGTIAVKVDRYYEVGPDKSWVYARLELDGSSYQPLLTRGVSNEYGNRTALGAQWFPDGTQLAFKLDNGIARMDLAGNFATIVPAPTADADLHCPQLSADGNYVFTHRSGAGGHGVRVWRAGVANGGADTVNLSPPTRNGGYTQDLCPSPSPDGRFIAVSSNRSPDDGPVVTDDYFLHIIDTQNGTVQRIERVGFPAVRWSPDGGWLVSASGGKLFVVRPNGTGYRELAIGYEPWASWSLEATGSRSSEWGRSST